MELKRDYILLIFHLIVCLSDVSTNTTDPKDLVFKDLCVKNSKCIMKCCGTKQYIKVVENELKCDENIKTTVDLKTLDDEFSHVFVHKPNITTFEIKHNGFQLNKTLQDQSIDVTDIGFNVYLDEHGEVKLETPNAYDQWTLIPNDMYCLDHLLVEEENKTDILKPSIYVIYQNVEEKASRPVTKLMNAGMIISSFFLFLVLVVYGLLPELRKLSGMILMAYVASLFSSFLLLTVMRMTELSEKSCENLTYLIYYFFMASFCWMNVMSCDIWWTFRGYAKTRPIHRRGEKFKFLMYCLYAFGLPLAMTVMLAVLNNTDMTRIPWFITPKIATTDCFIEGGEQFLYMYVPMLVLILCNWLFFLMTAFNIWRLVRGTAVLDDAAAGTPHAHRTNRKRFIIYLKLSVVMGLNWLLEVISYSSTESKIWLISDCYNILIGVAIFAIFVCKRKIWNQLKIRFSQGKNSKWYPNREDSSKVVTSTCDSSVSASQKTQAQSVPLVSYNKTDVPEIVLNER